MPTSLDFEELINNCSWKWVEINGVQGCQFTASNGNTLFLPASGRMDNLQVHSVTTNCDYWTSERDLSKFRAKYFSSAAGHVDASGTYFRWQGMPVRPVTE